MFDNWRGLEKLEGKPNIKKLLIIAVGSILGLIIVLGSVAYIIVRSYVSKINYVPLEEMAYTEEDLEEDWDYVEGGDHEEDLNYELGRDYEEDLVKEPWPEEENQNQVHSDSKSDQTIPAEPDPSLASTNIHSVSSEASNLNGEETNLEALISRNINDSSDIMKDKNVLNVLLIGTDNRKMGQRGLSDSMIIVSINSNTKRIIATSLLRDIYLYIPGKKNNNRLNTAYAAGGTKLLIETIEKNFKLSIDKYVSVDFYAFIDIVDQVGGVTIEVTKEELPYVNNYIREINQLENKPRDQDCLAEAGTYLLNGKQTLGYTRVRYVGTDFGRTARQREVLELIFHQLKGMKMTDLAKLLNSILPELTTNFSENELISQIVKLPGYLDYELDSWSIPVKGSYENVKIRGMSVLGIDFDMNIDEIYQKIYLTELCK